MKFETELRQAQNLGSAKSGLHSWIAQRVTAVALIPLGIWFVFAFSILLTSPYEKVHQWFASPMIVALFIFLIITLFYHGYLGVKIIWEDYISHKLTKWILLIMTKLFSMGMALLALISLLKIFLR